MVIRANETEVAYLCTYQDVPTSLFWTLLELYRAWYFEWRGISVYRLQQSSGNRTFRLQAARCLSVRLEAEPDGLTGSWGS